MRDNLESPVVVAVLVLLFLLALVLVHGLHAACSRYGHGVVVLVDVPGPLATARDSLNRKVIRARPVIIIIVVIIVIIIPFLVASIIVIVVILVILLDPSRVEVLVVLVAVLVAVHVVEHIRRVLAVLTVASVHPFALIFVASLAAPLGEVPLHLLELLAKRDLYTTCARPRRAPRRRGDSTDVLDGLERVSV